jgi:hypothetical protein
MNPAVINNQAAPMDKEPVIEIRPYACRFELNSTLSDFMNTIIQYRHSGRDCRNPGSMDGLKLTIHGTGYPLPGGYDELTYNLTK